MSDFELDFILNSKGLNCDSVKNSSEKTVRITGVSSDVKTLITILRDYQNPSSSIPDSNIPKANKKSSSSTR